MLLLTYFLWLIAATELVIANNFAFPYEMIYAYNVYKLEYMAKGPRTLAKDCKHKPGETPADEDFNSAASSLGITGICTFDEFVMIILQTESGVSYVETTAGTTLNPDVQAIKAKFRGIANNFKSSHNYYPKFLINTDVLVGLKHTPWADVLDNLKTVAEESIDTIATTNGGKASANAKSVLQDSVDVLKLAEAVRATDFNRFLVLAFENDPNNAQSPFRDFITTRATTVRVPGKGSETSKLYSRRATISRTKSALRLDFVDTTALDRWIAKYGNNMADDRTTYNHKVAMEAMKKIEKKFDKIIKDKC